MPKFVIRFSRLIQQSPIETASAQFYDESNKVFPMIAYHKHMMKFLSQIFTVDDWQCRIVVADNPFRIKLEFGDFLTSILPSPSTWQHFVVEHYYDPIGDIFGGENRSRPG